jgi:proteasome lid subunit RPN8/RPN11
MPMFRPTRKRKKGEEPGDRFSNRRIRGIKRYVIESLMSAGASTYPNEFGGILRSEETGIITDILLIPGTTAGHRHANFQLYMLPVDLSVVGTAHSHPSGALRPSEEDLSLFRRWGRLHIILGHPFMRSCWKAYDGQGEEVHLEVVR